MKKTKLLKISKWMLFAFFLIMFARLIPLLLIDESIAFLVGLILLLLISLVAVATFLIKHIIEKTQSTVLLVIAFFLEVNMVLALLISFGSSLLSAIITLDITACVDLLFTFPIFIMFFCDLIALFMPKD